MSMFLRPENIAGVGIWVPSHRRADTSANHKLEKIEPRTAVHRRHTAIAARCPLHPQGPSMPVTLWACKPIQVIQHGRVPVIVGTVSRAAACVLDMADNNPCVPMQILEVEGRACSTQGQKKGTCLLQHLPTLCLPASRHSLENLFTLLLEGYVYRYVYRVYPVYYHT
jgi:hypothetical protein